MRTKSARRVMLDNTSLLESDLVEVDIGMSYPITLVRPGKETQLQSLVNDHPWFGKYLETQIRVSVGQPVAGLYHLSFNRVDVRVNNRSALFDAVRHTIYTTTPMKWTGGVQTLGEPRGIRWQTNAGAQNSGHNPMNGDPTWYGRYYDIDASSQPGIFVVSDGTGIAGQLLDDDKRQVNLQKEISEVSVGVASELWYRLQGPGLATDSNGYWSFRQIDAQADIISVAITDASVYGPLKAYDGWMVAAGPSVVVNMEVMISDTGDVLAGATAARTTQVAEYLEESAQFLQGHANVSKSVEELRSLPDAYVVGVFIPSVVGAYMGSPRYRAYAEELASSTDDINEDVNMRKVNDFLAERTGTWVYGVIRGNPDVGDLEPGTYDPGVTVNLYASISQSTGEPEYRFEQGGNIVASFASEQSALNFASYIKAVCPLEIEQSAYDAFAIAEVDLVVEDVVNSRSIGEDLSLLDPYQQVPIVAGSSSKREGYLLGLLMGANIEQIGQA